MSSNSENCLSLISVYHNIMANKGMKTPLAPLKLLWISYNLVALCHFFSAVGELKGKFGLGKKKCL